MFIIDFIKSLLGNVNSRPQKNQEVKVADATTDAKSTENKEAVKEVPKVDASNDASAYEYSNQITIGDKMYKLSDYELHLSSDGGKKWELVTELPIIVDGLTTDDKGELVIIGRLQSENVMEKLRNSAILVATAFAGDKIYDKTAEILNNLKEWGRKPRAFKFIDGKLYVDTQKGSLSNFVNIPATRKEMTLCMDAIEHDEEIKKEMKALGLKKVDTVKVQICHYYGGEEVVVSLDGKRWYRHQVDLPKKFKSFKDYRSIVVATDTDGKKYFYYGGEWNLIDFESDLEICERDVEDKVYKMLNCKENTYSYDNNSEVKTKTVHLLIMSGKKGIFNDSASIYYIANDHVRHDEFNNDVEMDEISNVKELYGEVYISGEVKKKTVTQIFAYGSWHRCGAFNNDDDEEEVENYVGPFCFETYILEDDPFWDCVDSPINEYQLDAKKKDSFKARKMVVKVLKQTPDHILYLDKNGSWKVHSDVGIDYERLYNTGEPKPIWNKKKNEILYYVHYPMTFYEFNGTKVHQWTRKKKGIFSKHIEYEWDKVDPVDREMINKVKVKKGFFNS